MTPTYISYLGWNSIHYTQGQFRMDEGLLEEEVDKVNDARARWNANRRDKFEHSLAFPKTLLDEIDNKNRYSLIPLVNIACGFNTIVRALFCPDEKLFVEKKQVTACRLLLFTVGVLEITWIGAIVIHGLASLYFVVDQAINRTDYLQNGDLESGRSSPDRFIREDRDQLRNDSQCFIERPLDVTEQNTLISSPSNPNGEIQSLLNPNEKLSSEKWSVSIVLTKNSSHARTIFEVVDKHQGRYELIDVDIYPIHVRTTQGELKIVKVREFTNSEKSLDLDDIEVRIGPLFQEWRSIAQMIQFIQSKKNHTAQIGRCPFYVENPPLFDLLHPDPEKNVFNHITFALEAAKAGGVDLYADLSDRIVPSFEEPANEELD